MTAFETTTLAGGEDADLAVGEQILIALQRALAGFIVQVGNERAAEPGPRKLGSRDAPREDGRGFIVSGPAIGRCKSNEESAAYKGQREPAGDDEESRDHSSAS